jgi:hypothetical protein
MMVSACCVVLFLAGCTAQSLDLSLAPTDRMMMGSNARICAGTIGVKPFIDQRPVMHGSDNTKWKGLIPGVLWLEISSDIPEIYTAYSHYESKSLDRETTKGCVAILQRSGLFTAVTDLEQQPDVVTDYLLQGVVYKTEVKETGYYYGSCIYAWLLRILGLPYVSFEIEYHIGFSITDVRSGKVVWKTEIQGVREDKFYTVYSISRGRDGKHVIAWNIADILAEEFNHQAVDLQQAVLKNH